MTPHPGQVVSTASAPDPHTGGLVSIMVMYRPPPSAATTAAAAPFSQPAKSLDQPPPTYESLFLGENPPGRPPANHLPSIQRKYTIKNTIQKFVHLKDNLLLDLEAFDLPHPVFEYQNSTKKKRGMPSSAYTHPFPLDPVPAYTLG